MPVANKNPDLSQQSSILLAQSLSPAERKEFEFVTIHDPKKGRKRDKLWYAIQDFLRGKGKLQRKKVFASVFEEPWEESKDYLLRNELRHLGNALKEFIALKEMKRQMESGRLEAAPWLVEGIHRRGLPDLADKALRQAQKKAQSKRDPSTHRSLLRLKLRLLAEETDFKEATFRQMIASATEAIAVLGQESAYELAEINAVRAHADSVLWSLDSAHSFAGTDSLPAPATDPYLRYLALVTQAAQQSGKDRQSSFIQALECLQDLDTPRLDKASVRGRLENNVALEYMHSGDFEQAILHFDRALHSSNRFPAALRQVIQFNRITAMLRTSQNEAAYEALSGLEQEQIQHPQILGMLPKMKVQALIQLGRYAEARQAIPLDGGSGSQADQQYLRLCLAIAFFETGDVELALREAGNLRKSLRTAGVLDHFQEAAGWLHKMIHLKDMPDPKRKERGMHKLYAELEDWFTQNPGPHAETLPIKWIRERISKELA